MECVKEHYTWQKLKAVIYNCQSLQNVQPASEQKCVCDRMKNLPNFRKLLRLELAIMFNFLFKNLPYSH